MKRPKLEDFEALTQVTGPYDLPAYVDQLNKFIDHLESYSNWISVKGRLPEYHKYVLCYDAELRFIEVLRWSQNKYFISDSYLVNTNVTHWKPLPEPPKDL
jgi:hypothetical protein